MAVMLTTVDNPYNPFTQWDSWYAFDTQKGYNTCGYLARVAQTSEAFPEKLEEEAIAEAIDDICRLNINGMYRKVTDGDDDE